MRSITLRAFNRDAAGLNEPVQITHRDSVLGTFTPASFTYTSSVAGSEVRFATNTPPTQDLADITPTATVSFPGSVPETEHFNTRPFTPVPKTTRKK